MSEVVLEIMGMSKNFGPVVALKDVALKICRGQVHGLVGENGSGKSTITSIAAGMQPATSGEMLFMGKPWKPASMIEAQHNGLSMILQEANTIPGCTVAENLFAGKENEYSRFGFVNNRKMNADADALLDRFGISYMRGKDPIDQYGFEDRKLIEIARAVNEDTEILIVDETTTALSMEGRDILYKIVEDMVKRDKAVIFISHDMDEIMEKCTILTVLRDGEIRGTVTSEEIGQLNSIGMIRQLMVGRDIGNKFYRSDYDPSCSDEVVLEFTNVSGPNVKDFSLKLHKGEIVGIGGLSGCGMHDIGRMAFGMEEIDRGSIKCRGKEVESAKDAVEKGIGYISKNRDTEAVILQGPIENNIVLPSLKDISKAGFVSPKKRKQLADEQIKLLKIKCNKSRQWVNTLSGGNKQKVSFAKWIAKGSDIVIMDCPTRGVDIGVKQSMYSLIDQMKHEGKAILMISEEMSELIGMSDRLIVMKDFKISKEFIRSAELSEADVIEYMI
ncbi:sugar ABC transporter ATP-binding protein [Anaerobium acetethylicum]|uniref:Ribose transport system ATP-binding protein n=1 Tax=Anaerobium acetethylicum TaxID=1619234 RepID=A0A1D3TSX5_9FIRM|nr:sugar ABC transporter ATP-binding protein [Anaerobium acetethylicum]SCP97014.1 ribose transport system ATP-binding protein [Anaerobium acetethylicum]